MTERSHLSIGEVLSLLREEFPDVTISKIRFLESQGLVDPERTPSGYRKFYDHDVERLRWILRQQRENFLPLKIIRGRLTEQGEDLDDNGPGDGYDGGYGNEADPRAGAADDAVGSAANSPAGDHERTIEDATVTHPSAGTRQAGNPTHTPVPPASAPPASVPAASVPPASAGAPRPATSTSSATGASTPGPAGAGPGLAGRAGEGSRGPDRAAGRGASGPAADPPSGRVGGSTPAGAATGGASRGRSVASAGLRPSLEDTETYSIEELASASGGTVAIVKSLQEFGLISIGTVVAGTPYFDATALAVARAAAGFARHGVDARHLRAWRNSADREAGIFEQVIMPLLRQRNPEARRQAADTLAELTSLGGDLRKALLDQAVRQIH